MNALTLEQHKKYLKGRNNIDGTQDFLSDNVGDIEDILDDPEDFLGDNIDFLGDNNMIDKLGENLSDNIVGGPEDFLGDNIVDTDNILTDNILSDTIRYIEDFLDDNLGDAWWWNLLGDNIFDKESIKVG